MLLEHLKHQLTQIDSAHVYWIAYSGGLDSHVLLHAMAELRRQIPGLCLRAVHVHHGLSPRAQSWVEHCQGICAGLNVDFYCEYLQGPPSAGESIEAWARQARYDVFAKMLTANAMLLTAHTQDDQAETVLLQLLRGSGPKGLAAMPQQQAFATGIFLRPFLNLTRRQLQEYAQRQGLCWLEDESNADPRFDRNFLRHRVLPILHERWPSAAKSLARSANHCAEAADGLNELAQLDLVGEFPEFLSIESLRALSPARQRNVLRYWLSGRGCRLPNTRQIQHIQQDLIHGRADAQPQLSWGGWTIRRYRQLLSVEKSAIVVAIHECIIAWDLSIPLALPHGLGKLFAQQQLNGGLSLQVNPQHLTIRFRKGGERCHLLGRTQSTTLKKLFQEWRVPPWQRSTIPLLYHGNELAAIIGYGICAPFAAAIGEMSWKITRIILKKG